MKAQLHSKTVGAAAIAMILSILAAAPSGHTAAIPIINPSFESPDVFDQTYNGDIDGWGDTVSGEVIIVLRSDSSGNEAHYDNVRLDATSTRPVLDLSRAGTGVTCSWPTNHAGYFLEQATSLLAADWRTVSNSVTITGDRAAVTVEAEAEQGFFRLSKQEP